MRSKQKKEENYLERCPKRPERFGWTQDEEGLVTLEIENKGIMNRIAQKLLKKPEVTHIHLDEYGSFIWGMIDGERTIEEMGAPMEERFGDAAKPTYERLAKFFQILESYNFVEWK